MSTARDTLNPLRTMAHRVGEPPVERRNAASRAAVLRRVSREFHEMPVMRLSATQAQRLFGLRQDVCARVLATLVDEAIIRCDSNGAYRLLSDHS